MALRGLALAFALIGGAQCAFAGDVAGVWLHQDGGSKVRFAPCGAAICGTIVWLKVDTKGEAKVGQRVFFRHDAVWRQFLERQGVRTVERPRNIAARCRLPATV